jgi:cytochrome c oxidase cbb3-type subunit 3
MEIEERDEHTGYMTTGHEWNGIKELNTPVPRPVFYFLGAAVFFSLVYWLLMPAWPLGTTYTKGLLGINDRANLAESLQTAALSRDEWTKRIETEGFKDIQSDPVLMIYVRQTGHTLFGDNCAACHGLNAEGGKGFPELRSAAAGIWGRDPETIFETIRVGINSAHPKSRISQMPDFGRDKILKPDEIANVAAYVHSLSKPEGKEAQASTLDAGKAVFVANCSPCHGQDAKGTPQLGAPNLTDTSWIYGGDLQTIYTTVWNGRQGHMPSWEARLTPVERKILTLYLVDRMAAAP